MYSIGLALLFSSVLVATSAQGMNDLPDLPNLMDAQIISCLDPESGRSFKIEVLNTQKQVAHLTYSSGGAPIIDHDGAYSRSGTGYTFAVMLPDRPTFTAFLDLDQHHAHVPRNGPIIPCGESVHY